MAIGTVVIVPGICGSELLLDRGWWGRYLVWVSPASLVAGGFRLLELNPAGTGPVALGGATLSPGQPLRWYYGLLAADLARRGWRVLAPVGDWRGTAAADGQRLADLILANASAAPLRLVTHSRGGLVTRWALAILQSAGRLGLVDRVAGLGVPHTGSLTAAMLLAGTDESSGLIRHLLGYLPSDYRTLIGGDQVQQTVRTWPSAYELLPRPGAAWVKAPGAAGLYDIGTWNASGLTVSALHLASALAMWGSAPDSPAGVEWVDFYSSSFITPDAIPYPAQLARPDAVIYGGSGDGVVHEGSARQPGRRSVECPTSHRAYPWDGRVLSVVSDVLSNGLSEDIRIQGVVFN